MKLYREERELLKRIYEERQKEKEHYDIADSLFVVEKKVWTPTEEGSHNKEIFTIDQHAFDTIEELEEYLTKSFCRNVDGIIKKAPYYDKIYCDNGIVVNRTYMKYDYEPVAYFLTEYEAIRYTEYQKHNLDEFRIKHRAIGHANCGDLAKLIAIVDRFGKELDNKE